MIPHETRATYVLYLHSPDGTLKALEHGVLLVAQEVAAINRCFCATGQLKRFRPDHGSGIAK